MVHIIRIDGRMVKDFNGEPIGVTGDMNGWYPTATSELGTIRFTNDLKNAYRVEGRINLRSTFERISDRMSIQGLKFKSLEFIALEELAK